MQGEARVHRVGWVAAQAGARGAAGGGTRGWAWEKSGSSWFRKEGGGGKGTLQDRDVTCHMGENKSVSGRRDCRGMAETRPALGWGRDQGLHKAMVGSWGLQRTPR